MLTLTTLGSVLGMFWGLGFVFFFALKNNSFFEL